jgi:hypothetical protein
MSLEPNRTCVPRQILVCINSESVKLLILRTFCITAGVYLKIIKKFRLRYSSVC